MESPTLHLLPRQTAPPRHSSKALEASNGGHRVVLELACIHHLAAAGLGRSWKLKLTWQAALWRKLRTEAKHLSPCKHIASTAGRRKTWEARALRYWPANELLTHLAAAPALIAR